MQKRLFSSIGLKEEDVWDKFSFLIEALEYGAPPHGGIALGFDRMMMTILGLSTIRDVIAFPKTQSATCLLTSAPAPVAERQLEELHIRTVVDEESDEDN